MAGEAEEADRNPVKDVAYLKTGSQGHHLWTLEQVEQYEEAHPIGTRALLALALLLYAGQLRSDIVPFGRQHVKNGWLWFTQQKNKSRKPITLEIPIVPELQKTIDASPCGDLTFLVTEFGNPFTSNCFGNRMRKWCDEAGLEHCSAPWPTEGGGSAARGARTLNAGNHGRDRPHDIEGSGSLYARRRAKAACSEGNGG